ncbi:probable inactive receptor kinase At1g48480 [Solanum pennellii]|uniref:Probable inactive receptor kinase At1g48480 n=1 Tax=Solanum pennellii TaxID=28526 RepID=A0ABM1FXP9_SOLPN|nr:probable inactive receptor kinase At1g48480 [Solanum pennellii]
MSSTHFISFLFLSLLISGIFSDLNADRAALLHLSAAFRGRTLRWNATNSTPCSWEGVKCDTTINRVIELRLPGYGLSGEMPLNSIGNLTELRTLSLRSNSLSGLLPPDIGSCTELRILNLENNNFSGSIPTTFFNLNNLIRVSLSGNRFSGEISDAFNNLTRMRTLYLENNNFSGSLPDLKNLSQLNEFNVSFNRLTGSIPSSLNQFLASSFLGNSLCCSLSPCPENNNITNQSDKLSSVAIAGIVIGSIIGFCILLLVLFMSVRSFYRSKKSFRQVNVSPTPNQVVSSPHDSIVTENHDIETVYSDRKDSKSRVCDDRTKGMVYFGESFELFGLEDLLMASAEVLGKGLTGTTYKAYLDRDVEVVVKRLRNVCVSEEEFRAKMEVCGGIGHGNLVPLRAYYYGREEKLVVYDSMPTSLYAVLHGGGVSKEALTWVIRSRIALGVANGMEYLHSLGPKVTHGNIKSSNILLTHYYDAYVSEFGITQLISSTSNSKMTGYYAPEVTNIRNVSQKADVYSFGTVLLELLTGKNPSSVINDEGIDLPKWVKCIVQERGTTQVFDPELIRFQNCDEEQMVSLLHLAISCTSQHPERRPPMADTTRRIKEIVM